MPLAGTLARDDPALGWGQAGPAVVPHLRLAASARWGPAPIRPRAGLPSAESAVPPLSAHDGQLAAGQNPGQDPGAQTTRPRHQGRGQGT